MVEGLDLSKFHQSILAREGEPGQLTIDPAILVALWMYGTSRGVGSGRELDWLCKEHDDYRWICGEVSVNYHALNDFRVGHQAALDELFTQVLAVMTKAGLVTLSRVAQDGTRVRADAGADSFRRERTLREHLKEAKAQVEHVKELANDPTVTAREAAGAQRGAKDREARIQKALEELPKAREAKKTQKERCETAELVNAVVRTRFGLDHFPVRGLNKVLSVSLWMALTYNVLRFISLSSG